MVRLVKIGGILMKKLLAGAVLFIAGAACGLIFTYGPLHAQEPVNEDDIMVKLDEISKSQSEMAATIKSMKDDIQIIKLRITQMQ